MRSCTILGSAFLIYCGWFEPLSMYVVFAFLFRYGSYSFRSRSSMTSRKSVRAIPVSIVILNPIDSKTLWRDFLSRSSSDLVLQSTIAKPSSLYKPYHPFLRIFAISARINKPSRSHTSAPWKLPMATSNNSSLTFFFQISPAASASIVLHECMMMFSSSWLMLLNCLAKSSARISCAFVIEG